jgi:hypothetical protein
LVSRRKRNPLKAYLVFIFGISNRFYLSLTGYTQVWTQMYANIWRHIGYICIYTYIDTYNLLYTLVQKFIFKSIRTQLLQRGAFIMVQHFLTVQLLWHIRKKNKTVESTDKQNYGDLYSLSEMWKLLNFKEE